MAAKWLTQADAATQRLFEAEKAVYHLLGSGLDEFLGLPKEKQRKRLAKVHGQLSEGRDLVHKMVETFYDIHCQKGGKRG